MIIGNLTDALDEAFPDTTVFPALGNHDWSPKNQIPAQDHFFYHNLSDMWTMWLPTDEENKETFKKGEKINNFLCKSTQKLASD